MTPAKFEAVEALRRVPKQGRGQRRVEHILKSAEALFAEVGFDNATTNAVASRAGVSIGSLYQFFESKDAILEAVASRYLDQSRRTLSKLFASVTSDTEVDDFIAELLESMIRLQESRPYYLQCLAWSRPSPVLNRRVDELFEWITENVGESFAKIFGEEVDPKLVALRARISVQAIGALVPIAFYARGKDRAQNTREIQTLLVNYVAPAFRGGR
jgi:AcrR family transcriptional regulator